MKLLLFRSHAHDPLDGLINAITRTVYTHAAILTDEATNEISEAYFPYVHRRFLLDAELETIDAFDITGLTPARVQSVLAYCAAAEAVKEPYSIENLFRFEPIFRRFLGEAKDLNDHTAVICSQYAFDALDRGGGVKLLNAPSYELAPGYLAWSPFCVPAPALKPVGRTV